MVKYDNQFNTRTYYTNLSISAQCTGLDPVKHENLTTAAIFPVPHGETIVVTCEPGYIKSQDSVTLTCLDGTDFSQVSELSCRAGKRC